ncbi:hypothetical protein TrST_g13795 [Triparma strigata]|uniref:Uncharacterized protein n=1 Tax=Triparma strigata TaxID=1606541 RepID=A0A9W7AQQ3_9STRA|nr:hypothetical protein TrST_g13795 [Triparma strigata]
MPTTFSLPSYSTERFYMLSTLELKASLRLQGVDIHNNSDDNDDNDGNHGGKARPVIVYVLVENEGYDSHPNSQLLSILCVNTVKKIMRLLGTVGDVKDVYVVLDFLDLSNNSDGHKNSVGYAGRFAESLFANLKEGLGEKLRGMTVGVSNDKLVAPAMSVMLACVEKEDDNENRFIISAERDDMTGSSGADEETDAVAKCEQTGITVGVKFDDWFDGFEREKREGLVKEERRANFAADALIAVLILAVVVAKWKDEIVKFVFREPIYNN